MTRTLRLLTFLVVCVPAISAAAQSPLPKGAPFEGVWKAVEPADGRFKILLPGMPAESTDQIETQYGKLERRNFTLQTTHASYHIAYFDLPAKLTVATEVKQQLNSARDRELERLKGRLLREREISLAGHDGLEVDLASTGVNFRLRYYLVDQRLYQVAVSSPALSFLNEKDATEPPHFTEESPERRKLLLKAFRNLITNDFFNSFKLLPVLPQPDPKNPVKGGVLTGYATKKVGPSYPQQAKFARVTGTVGVKVLISENGRVIDAEIVSGSPLLWDASINAAKQWEFKPTEINGVQVKVNAILTFNFNLQ